MPRRKPQPDKAPPSRRLEDQGAEADWRKKRAARETREEREGARLDRGERQG